MAHRQHKNKVVDTDIGGDNHHAESLPALKTVVLLNIEDSTAKLIKS